MSHAKHMWDTAAATEHNAEPASASERRLAADGAAATELPSACVRACVRACLDLLLRPRACYYDSEP